MTEEERKKKVADYKKRVQEQTKKMLAHQSKMKFKENLLRNDPKAASAASEYNVRKRSGESPADIAASYSPEKKADMRRYIDAASAFRRKLID